VEKIAVFGREANRMAKTHIYVILEARMAEESGGEGCIKR